MSRYERDIDEYKRDIDVIWTPSPEKKIIWAVYIRLYLFVSSCFCLYHLHRYEQICAYTYLVHICSYCIARIYTDIDRYEHVWEICTISDVKMHSSASQVVRAVAWHWKVLGSIPGADMGIFDFWGADRPACFENGFKTKNIFC